MKTHYAVRLVQLFIAAAVLSGCYMNSTIASLDNKEIESVFLKVAGEPTLVSIEEGSSVVLVVTLSKVRKTATPFSLTIAPSESTANVVMTSVFPGGATYTGSIAEGATASTIVINTINNPAFTGDRLFQITVASGDREVLGSGLQFNLNVVDLQSMPVLSFATLTQTPFENDGALTATINLSVASAEDITVDYVVADGTATSAADYTASSGSVTFTAGQTSKTVSFSIVDDAVGEATENFTLTLDTVAAGRATISATSKVHTVGIVDNESSTIAIDNVSGNEGSSQTFTVTMLPASSQTVTVNWASANATATSGTHYTAGSGTLSFAPGETTKNIVIATTAIGAEVCAANRTYEINLSSASNAAIGVGQGIGTIVDPDRPTLSINANVSATEGSDISFTASISAACTGRTVSFDWATTDGTATQPTDYGSVSSSGSITSGNTTATLTVNTVGNTTYQGNRAFTATLSNPVNATIATATRTGTITEDDPSAASSLTWSTFSPSFSTSITASWTMGVNVTTQRIRYFTDSSCTTAAAALTDIGATDTTHTYTGTLLATYWYKVYSYNAAATLNESACVATGMLIDPDSCSGDRATNTPFANSGQPGATGASLATNFTICSRDQLYAIGADSTRWNKFYKLNADIDMTGGGTYVPIGNTTTNFTGDFNGNNKTISNFTFSGSTTDEFGLIGRTGPNVSVRNFTMSNVNISARNNVGAAVAAASASLTIDGVHVTGTITGNSSVGGVAGDICGTIRNSSNAASVLPTATGSTMLGGIAGRLGFCWGNTIDDSVNTGSIGNSIANASKLGGILGHNHSASSFMNRVRNYGTVMGVSEVGGIGGYNGTTLVDSFSTGDVSSSRGALGGLFGAVGGGTVIRRSFATGNVTATITSVFGGGSIGGLIGGASSTTIENSFYKDGKITVTGNGTNTITGVGGFIGAGNTNTYNDNFAAPRDVTLTSAAATVTVGFFAGSETDATGVPASTYSSVNHFDRLLNFRKIAGIGSHANPAGLTEVRNPDLKALAAGAVYNGWDTNVWRFIAGQYPQLKYFDPSCAGARATNTPFANSGETLLGSPVDGSMTRPFIFCTKAQLLAMAGTSAHWDKQFQLAADIDLTATAWTAIGTSVTNFTGSIDGKGFAISNLAFSTANTHDFGFFGFLGSSAKVSNLNLTGWNIVMTGSQRLGGLAANSLATISNVSLSGTVQTNSSYSGGFVAVMNGGSIFNSNTSGIVGGGSGNNGGMVGLINSGATATLESVYSTSTVSWGGAVGGIIGYDSGSSVILRNIHYNGNVTGGYGTGGIVGWGNSSTTMEFATSQGTVNAPGLVGGLMGRSTATLRDSWSTASVTSAGNTTGGAVGENHGPISRVSSSGLVTIPGNAANVGGLAGSSANTTISDSYSLSNIVLTGIATGGTIGGLVGWKNWPNIQRSFSVGSISLTGGWTGTLGGFLANRPAPWSANANNYWNTTTGPSADAVGNQPTDVVPGRTTLEMQVAQGTGGMYTGYSTSVWTFADGSYPALISTPRAP